MIITTPVRIPWSRGPTYDIDAANNLAQVVLDSARASKVFTKLYINSRKQLRRALNGRGSHSS